MFGDSQDDLTHEHIRLMKGSSRDYYVFGDSQDDLTHEHI